MLYVNTCHVSVGHPPSLVSGSWTIFSSIDGRRQLSVGLLKDYLRPRCLFTDPPDFSQDTRLSKSPPASGCQDGDEHSRISLAGFRMNAVPRERHYHHQLIVLKRNADSKLICFMLALVPFSTHAWNSLQLYLDPFFTRGIQHLDRENWILNR